MEVCLAPTTDRNLSLGQLSGYCFPRVGRGRAATERHGCGGRLRLRLIPLGGSEPASAGVASLTRPSIGVFFPALLDRSHGRPLARLQAFKVARSCIDRLHWISGFQRLLKTAKSVKGIDCLAAIRQGSRMRLYSPRVSTSGRHDPCASSLVRDDGRRTQIRMATTSTALRPGRDLRRALLFGCAVVYGASIFRSGAQDMVEEWARRLTHWWPHKHEGSSYPLVHLYPFRFSIELLASEKYAARAVEIRVGFSCHTFTRKPRGEDGDVQPYFQKGEEVRLFCHERYLLSKSLADIVKSLPNRKCYFAGRENYFIVEGHELLAAEQEYRVFFDVRHTGKSHAVLLFVQSAYPANRNKGAPHGIASKKVGFRVLVNHALRNTKPTPPP